MMAVACLETLLPWRPRTQLLGVLQVEALTEWLSSLVYRPSPSLPCATSKDAYCTVTEPHMSHMRFRHCTVSVLAHMSPKNGLAKYAGSSAVPSLLKQAIFFHAFQRHFELLITWGVPSWTSGGQSMPSHSMHVSTMLGWRNATDQPEASGWTSSNTGPQGQPGVDHEKCHWKSAGEGFHLWLWTKITLLQLHHVTPSFTWGMWRLQIIWNLQPYASWMLLLLAAMAGNSARCGDHVLRWLESRSSRCWLTKTRLCHMHVSCRKIRGRVAFSGEMGPLPPHPVNGSKRACLVV